MSIETSKTEIQIEKRMRMREQNTQELWDNYYKRCNIHVMNTRKEQRKSRRNI